MARFNEAMARLNAVERGRKARIRILIEVSEGTGERTGQFHDGCVDVRVLRFQISHGETNRMRPTRTPKLVQAFLAIGTFPSTRNK